MSFTPEQRTLLLQTARDALVYGVQHDAPPALKAAAYEEALRVLRATFVTLEKKHELRGCIGSLTAHRPLIEDIAYNAYAAGFSDPRFPPLRMDELDTLSIHISVLSPLEPVYFDSEEDLLQKIRPGVDGLVMEEHGRRGTFLPAVWESLPEARDFLRQLKRKSGLPADYWSNSLSVQRYTTEVIE